MVLIFMSPYAESIFWRFSRQPFFCSAPGELFSNRTFQSLRQEGASLRRVQGNLRSMSRQSIVSAGGIIVRVIAGVVSGEMDHQTWSPTANWTIWVKFIFDFIPSRHAHPIVTGKKKPVVEAGQKQK